MVKTVIAMILLIFAILWLSNSCGVDDSLQDDYRVVRVYRLNAQSWDVTPNQLITLRQLATQRYSTKIYRFELINECRAVVRSKDGLAGGVVTDLNQIASQSYNPEIYEFKLIECKD